MLVKVQNDPVSTSTGTVTVWVEVVISVTSIVEAAIIDVTVSVEAGSVNVMVVVEGGKSVVDVIVGPVNIMVSWVVEAGMVDVTISVGPGNVDVEVTVAADGVMVHGGAVTVTRTVLSVSEGTKVEVMSDMWSKDEQNALAFSRMRTSSHAATWSRRSSCGSDCKYGLSGGSTPPLMTQNRSGSREAKERSPRKRILSAETAKLLATGC